MSETNAEYVVKDLKECRTRIYSASEYEARLHANRQEKKVVEDVVGTEQSETRGSVEKQRDEDIRSWNTLRGTRYMCIMCAKRINFDSFRGEQGEVDKKISCWAQCTTQSESGWKNFGVVQDVFLDILKSSWRQDPSITVTKKKNKDKCAVAPCSQGKSTAMWTSLRISAHDGGQSISNTAMFFFY